MFDLSVVILASVVRSESAARVYSDTKILPVEPFALSELLASL